MIQWIILSLVLNKVHTQNLSKTSKKFYLAFWPPFVIGSSEITVYVRFVMNEGLIPFGVNEDCQKKKSKFFVIKTSLFPSIACVHLILSPFPFLKSGNPHRCKINFHARCVSWYQKMTGNCAAGFGQSVIRLEICQKIYTTEFLGQKFYTLKVRKLQLVLLKKKQQKCINIVT